MLAVTVLLGETINFPGLVVELLNCLAQLPKQKMNQRLSLFLQTLERFLRFSTKNDLHLLLVPFHSGFTYKPFIVTINKLKVLIRGLVFQRFDHQRSGQLEVWSHQRFAPLEVQYHQRFSPIRGSRIRGSVPPVPLEVQKLQGSGITGCRISVHQRFGTIRGSLPLQFRNQRFSPTSPIRGSSEIIGFQYQRFWNYRLHNQ